MPLSGQQQPRLPRWKNSFYASLTVRTASVFIDPTEWREQPSSLMINDLNLFVNPMACLYDSLCQFVFGVAPGWYFRLMGPHCFATGKYTRQ